MTEDLELKYLAARALKRKILMRVIVIVLSALLGLLLVTSAAGSSSQKPGVFEIKSYEKDEVAISLSNTADFANPTTVIEGESVEEMTNISGLRDIPADITATDGSHNGEYYFAHTFYVRNTCNKAIDLLAVINIVSAHKGADEAMYVRVYEDDSPPVTYAKIAKDGMKEFGTDEPFFDKTKVMSKTFGNVAPNETKKFTVVIWLEGSDPDCTDDIMGGFVRFSMDFFATEYKTPSD